MKHKKYLIFLTCEAVMLFVISILSHRTNTPITSILAFPFEQIANGLMLLASAGRIGNGFAMMLMVCFSLIPTMIAFTRKKKSKFVCIALNITSVVILAALCGMMNPYRFFPSVLVGVEEFVPVSMGVFGVAIWSCIVACVVLQLLNLFRSGETESLRRYFVLAILSIGALFTGFCFSAPVSSLIGSINDAQSRLDAGLAVLRFAASVIPCVMNIWICITIVDLTQTIEQNRSEEIKTSAEKVVNRCYLSLGTTVSLTAILNILQVAFMKYLSNIHTHVDIPIVGIVFALMILLVSRLLVENRNLRDDNDLFI